jgi:hypothetical protein
LSHNVHIEEGLQRWGFSNGHGQLGDKMNKRLGFNLSGIVFLIFSILALFLIISPLLVKNDVIARLARWYLGSIGNYSGNYIGAMGGIIGTGLAVSSALWISGVQERKNRELIELKNQRQKTLTYRRIERYLKRELKRLWIMWLWVTFDLNVYFDSEKEYPYEPYSIDISQVLDDFIIIEEEITEKNVELFYELFFFSEKINYLIDLYNSLRTDTVIMRSSGISYNNSVNIESDVSQSQSSYKIIESLKILISEKKNTLFKEELISIESQIEVLRNSQHKWGRFNDLKSKIAKKMINPEEHSNDGILKHYTLEKEIEKWLGNENESDIPNIVLEDIKNLKALKIEISEYEGGYDKIKMEYRQIIDKPPYSEEMNELVKEIVKYTTYQNTIDKRV